MEINDEDVIVHGTDLHKYLLANGYSQFESSSSKSSDNIYSPESYIKKQRCSKKIDRPIQNYKKNHGLYIAIIKTILESQLMFKEDTLFVNEFIPSNQNIACLSFHTLRYGIIFLFLCILCTFLRVFSVKYTNEWTALYVMSLWFGYILLVMLYDLVKNNKTKEIVSKTIKSMKESSLLVQKITHFLQECNNLHDIYNGCKDTYTTRNPNAFIYLMMPELKLLLLTIIQDLINSLVQNISEIHKFFPLKDSVSNIVYLYLTDSKVNIQDISLENLNKVKYTYFLLQSEFLKLSTLCLCPILWTPNSYSQINHLIETVGKIEKTYSNSYKILWEEYSVYILFKNNTEYNKQSSNESDINSDLKSKVYSVRQFLQNLMVHVRFMEDSIENSSKYCIEDLNSTLNVMIKELGIFNQLVTSLQIHTLKITNKNVIKSKTVVNDYNNEESDHAEPISSEMIKDVYKDELFFGISEELAEPYDKNQTIDEEIFDKSNNQNLILELKTALKSKEIEWKHREDMLVEKHPQLYNLSDEKKDNEMHNHNTYSNKVRKVALDLPPDESFPMQLPNKCFANEIAQVASKWNTTIQSFGDDSDSDVSINSSDS